MWNYLDLRLVSQEQYDMTFHLLLWNEEDGFVQTIIFSSRSWTEEQPYDVQLERCFIEHMFTARQLKANDIREKKRVTIMLDDSYYAKTA